MRGKFQNSCHTLEARRQRTWPVAAPGGYCVPMQHSPPRRAPTTSATTRPPRAQDRPRGHRHRPDRVPRGYAHEHLPKKVVNTTDHTRPAPYKLNSRLASITGPYTPGRPRAVRSVLRVELLLEPRLYHVHVHVHVVRVRRRLYTYASARRRWIAYTWLQLSIGN